MTPAVNVAKKAQIKHRLHVYQHEASSESYGLEAADKLGLPPTQVFKTLVVSIDGKLLVVAVIPVSSMLSMKAVAKAAAGKKASMANAVDVERSTAYVLGGVSPLGQKKRLQTFIDCSAEALQKIYISAGRRGLEIELDPGDLRNLTQASFATLTQ